MTNLFIAVQVIVALGIYNVWLLRTGKATNWRGGDAQNMKEEFEVYGLSETAMKAIGTLKVLFATSLLVGLFYPPVTQPAAIGLGILMLGAVAMHVKVQDPPMKSLPAFTMLVLCAVIAFAPA